MESEGKKAITRMAEFATIVALGIAIWVLPMDPAVRICLLLLAIVSGVLYLTLVEYTQANKRNRSAAAKIVELENAAADLNRAGELADGMVALYNSLLENPQTDDSHHFFEIVETTRLEGDDGLLDWRFRGVRDVPGASTALCVKITGDTPVDATTLSLVARDVVTRTPLSTVLVRDDPYVKAVEIRFAEALAEGAEFDVQLTVRWEGTFPRARRHDYLFSSWGRYAARGVDSLRCILSSDIDIANSTLEEIAEGKRQRAKVQPVTHQVRGRCEVEWSTEHPTGVQLLRFEKQL